MESSRCVHMCSVTGKAFCSGEGVSKSQYVLSAFCLSGTAAAYVLNNAGMLRHFAVV